MRSWTLHAYDHAPLNLTISVDPAPVDAGAPYSVSVTALPQCSANSAPNCSASDVSVVLSVTNDTTAGSAWTIALPAQSNGRWNLTLRAPPASFYGADPLSPARVVGLTVRAPAASNYSGTTSLSIVVHVPPNDTGGSLLSSPEAWTIALLVVGASVGIGAGVVWARRRSRRSPPSPSRPREGPGVPPGG